MEVSLSVVLRWSLSLFLSQLFEEVSISFSVCVGLSQLFDVSPSFSLSCLRRSLSLSQLFVEVSPSCLRRSLCLSCLRRSLSLFLSLSVV